MSKLCKHDAYLNSMKHREHGKITQYKYYRHTPLKMLSFDDPLTGNNKIKRPNRYGAYSYETNFFRLI